MRELDTGQFWCVMRLANVFWRLIYNNCIVVCSARGAEMVSAWLTRLECKSDFYAMRRAYTGGVMAGFDWPVFVLKFALSKPVFDAKWRLFQQRWHCCIGCWWGGVAAFWRGTAERSVELRMSTLLHPR